MPTVTGITIEFAGLGYTSGTAETCLNLEHGESDILSNLFVDITTDGNGSVLAATPTDAKTGLSFSVDQLVFIKPTIGVTDLCILKIVSVQGP